MLWNLYLPPDDQDFAGALSADSKEEAERIGAQIFGDPVHAVPESEDPAPAPMKPVWRRSKPGEDPAAADRLDLPRSA